MNQTGERSPHAVFAWDLFALLPPERWFAEAVDYLTCAVFLFEEMTATRLGASWPRAKAAGFLFAHGVELFLKAGLAQAGQKIPRTHDLKKLAARFHVVFPKDAYGLGAEMSEFIDENDAVPFATFLKYPERIADVGVTWNASTHIEVDRWATLAGAAKARAEQIWRSILELYPRNVDAWQGKVDVELE